MIEEGVRLIGNVVLGEGVSISAPADLMAKDSSIVIGDGCDIAAFVTISTADSHMRCLGLSDVIERREILIGNRVFIGTGAVILGGCEIGDGSVIGANVVLKGVKLPPDSRVTVGAMVVESGFYRQRKLF
jgi:carbonic anhydrase/acetyltransferase-like protein (isoleucine patch superfamily)